MRAKRYLPILALLFALFVAIPFVTFGATENEYASPFSPALNVLAYDLDFVKNAAYGEAISFSVEDLDQAFGLEKVNAVTILSLPPAQDGRLYLGDVVVQKNQTIARKDFSLLKFVPRSASVCDSSFLICNSGDEMTYQIPCTLLYSQKGNQAPIFAQSEQYALEVSTISDISVSQRLHAIDPEGDTITYSILSYPEKGVLVLEDEVKGIYTYYPKKGCTGKDAFTYVARDCYGNTSLPQTVSIQIDKSNLGILYTDLIDHNAHMAAIGLTQANIMSGVEVGGYQFFYPENTISRAEFLVMAMKCINIPLSENETILPFADAQEIAPVYVDYFATALENGIIEKSEHFYPNQAITRSEAAVVLQRLLNLPIPTGAMSFSDDSSIPTWAKSAINALCSVGILQPDEAYNIRPNAVLTRADGAQMLYATYQFSRG